MSSPSMIPPRDLTRIHRIIGECLDLWVEPETWQCRFLEGLAEVLRLPNAMFAHVAHFEPGKTPSFRHAVEVGWEDPEKRRHFFRVMEEVSPHPFTFSPVDLAMREKFAGKEALARSRGELVPDKEWHRSMAYTHYYEPAGMEELVYSARRLPTGIVGVLYLGGAGVRPGPRERQLAGYAHREIQRLAGKRLAMPWQVCTAGLSPRLLTLFHLLREGLSDKEIADRMNLSRATVSEYVQRVFRHFQVNGRNQLLAYLIAAKPRETPVRSGRPL